MHLNFQREEPGAPVIDGAIHPHSSRPVLFLALLQERRSPRRPATKGFMP